MRWPAASLGLAAAGFVARPARGRLTARYVGRGSLAPPRDHRRAEGAREEPGNRLSREMAVPDRIRLTGPLLALLFLSLRRYSRRAAAHLYIAPRPLFPPESDALFVVTS